MPRRIYREKKKKPKVTINKLTPEELLKLPHIHSYHIAETAHEKKNKRLTNTD